MKLAFGILSARESPVAVVQLVDSLGEGARVLLHHDHTKSPRPVLGHRPNVRFVREPVPTEWGGWSLCEAILRLMREALEDPDWDYFQLLSGSCLPIKPIDTFARQLDGVRADVNISHVALDADPAALMSHGFRAYAPADSTRHRVLRRVRRWYLGGQPHTEQRQGLGFAVPEPGVSPGLVARLALGGMRHVAGGRAPGFMHPFDDRLRCFVGSTWFGARRAVCEYIVVQPEDGPLQRYFKRVSIPDEFYFHTLLGNSQFVLADSNHLISRFDAAHPVRIGPQERAALLRSPRFFARKFPDDALSPVRLDVLARVATPARRPPRYVALH
jgi:hypothetical protein